MGQKLLEFFDKMKAKSGIGGMVKLAAMTKMSSVSAKEAEDSPENIKLFEESFAKI